MKKHPRFQEWCPCVGGWTEHREVGNNGETRTLRCVKCDRERRRATEAYLASLEDD